jgi:hypothetical protein
VPRPCVFGGPVGGVVGHDGDPTERGLAAVGRVVVLPTAGAVPAAALSSAAGKVPRLAEMLAVVGCGPRWGWLSAVGAWLALTEGMSNPRTAATADAVHPESQPSRRTGAARAEALGSRELLNMGGLPSL